MNVGQLRAILENLDDDAGVIVMDTKYDDVWELPNIEFVYYPSGKVDVAIRPWKKLRLYPPKVGSKRIDDAVPNLSR